MGGGLQAATLYHPLLPPDSRSLLPSAGEEIRIFEMCFDHQCSQKAQTLHCPEMKGIRPVSIYRWGFVCILYPLKRGSLDVIKRLIPKCEALKFFQMFCSEKGGCGTFRTSANLCHLPPSTPPQKKRKKFWLLTTKQIQMLDNGWAEDRDYRNRTVSILTGRSGPDCFYRFVGIGGKRTEQIFAQLVVIMA